VNRLVRNGMKIIVLSLLLLMIVGCYNGKQANMKAAGQTKNQMSAWLVHWDAEEGTQDFKAFERRLNEICFFGAYFNKDNKLFMPEEFAFSKRVSRKNQKVLEYLTIVNDRLLPDGSKEYKRTGFLKEKLKNSETRRAHVKEILSLTKDGRFDGVEIDYEKVWQDAETKDLFIKFIKELYAATSENNLKLRVVLEPGAPFNTISLPAGPKYVVMFYNLYGLHSGPGPKADKNFINKTLGKMAGLPEPKAVAFATGGCLWGSNGEKRFITEKEAKQMLKQYKVEAKRDNESKSVTFKYREGTTVYAVWYADAATINYWIRLSEDAGIRDIAIWRLGSSVTLDKIKRLH